MTRDQAMGNLVFGGAESPANPIDAAEVPIVRDNDVAIGQGEFGASSISGTSQ